MRLVFAICCCLGLGLSACKEVAYLVDFIRTAQRGVIIRRGGKKDEGAED